MWVFTSKVYVVTLKVYLLTLKLYVVTLKVYLLTLKVYLLTLKAKYFDLSYLPRHNGQRSELLTGLLIYRKWAFAVFFFFFFFFFQVSGQVTSERRCRWNQLKMLFPKGIECRNCPECPEGLGLVPQCGSRITTGEAVECTECQEGKSYSDTHDISSCKPCNICDPNEETISPCTRTKNAICGKCNAG